MNGNIRSKMIYNMSMKYFLKKSMKIDVIKQGLIYFDRVKVSKRTSTCCNIVIN